MASVRVASRVGTELTKCRHQSTATINIPEVEALPFEEVPTLKSTTWPFVGQLPGLTKVDPDVYKKYGFAKGYKIMGPLRKLTGGKDILKYYSPMMNPKGNGYVIYLFDPSMAELVLRNEGKYPSRGQTFDFLRVLRYSVA